MSEVVFIHRGLPTMASYRYRTAIPAEELSKINGFKVGINEGVADVVVFSKPSSEDEAVAQQAKREGAKIIVDLCDDHLNHPLIGPVYKVMIDVADHIVAPTQEMATRIKSVCNKPVSIIGDPYEQPLQPPHAVGDRLLWFGHNVNYRDMKPWMPLIESRKCWDLHIVTGPRVQGKEVLWSPESITHELAQANVVLLPTRKGAEYKSNNRMINAIRAGCFVVASHHPAYYEFRKMVWVGHLSTGLDWARAFPDDLNGLVAQAQAYVEAHYAPAKIAAQWAEVLK